MPSGRIAGLDPRLSGLGRSEIEGELSGVATTWWEWFEEGIERSPVHEVGADEAGEGERAVDARGGLLSQTQHQEGDESDGDLDAHGVLGSAEEVA